jgi:hypothetical protein
MLAERVGSANSLGAAYALPLKRNAPPAICGYLPTQVSMHVDRVSRELISCLPGKYLTYKGFSLFTPRNPISCYPATEAEVAICGFVHPLTVLRCHGISSPFWIPPPLIPPA